MHTGSTETNVGIHKGSTYINVGIHTGSTIGVDEGVELTPTSKKESTMAGVLQSIYAYMYVPVPCTFISDGYV